MIRTIACIWVLNLFIAQGLIGWENLQDVKFNWEYRPEVNAKVEMPVFGKKLLSLEGSVIELSGYNIPVTINRKEIILSKEPFASCFFCGGNGGPGSVVQVRFKQVPGRFKQDEIVHVKGKLKLNPDDFDNMVFILTDAEVIGS